VTANLVRDHQRESLAAFGARISVSAAMPSPACKRRTLAKLKGRLQFRISCTRERVYKRRVAIRLIADGMDQVFGFTHFSGSTVAALIASYCWCAPTNLM
jgi:hypothetical protein